MTTTIKTCFKCGERKPIFEFYKHKEMADGHLNKCKTCAKLDVSNHRHGTGRAKVLAYDRKRGNRHTPEYLVSYKKRFGYRAKIYSMVARAIRSGRITKLPCFVCGERAVAHHPDYDQPLSIVWLCQAHHLQAHAIVNTTK